jgi:outer membrane protein assembly factor BamB|tara:strand:+ start:4776 stop:6245 length:1470 start_codon:yes stop_codon:yes gene_type:complete
MRLVLVVFIFLVQTLHSQNSTITSLDSSNIIEVVNSTFLGNEKRNYYGNSLPDKLDVIWKHNLGGGKTTISRRSGEKMWYGSGWTGQPLLVLENNHPYIIQGTYSHKLKKIDAENGKLVWDYDFGDVIKGSGSIWINPSPDSLADALVITQGSRLGYGKYLDNPLVHSFRGISYFSGKELWRHNCRQTASYSRDVDGSALFINDTGYLAFENSYFTAFDPSVKGRIEADTIYKPQIYQQILLYNDSDRVRHRGNLVSESSPCLLGDRIYTASGTGHVYGYNLKKKVIDWDFFVGSDIDGSAIVTRDSCLLISVEKQYIDGQGGVLKLNPRYEPKNAVEWYLPTGNVDFAGWEGGVIGSCSVNDQTNVFLGRKIGVVSALDNYMYVFEYDNINVDSGKVDGPNLEHKYYQPKLLFKYNIHKSISTPIIIGNRILACGYGGCYLFEFDYDMNFKLLDHIALGEVESTPFSYYGKVYIGSRNGFLYCLGRKD